MVTTCETLLVFSSSVFKTKICTWGLQALGHIQHGCFIQTLVQVIQSLPQESTYVYVCIEVEYSRGGADSNEGMYHTYFRSGPSVLSARPDQSAYFF